MGQALHVNTCGRRVWLLSRSCLSGVWLYSCPLAATDMGRKNANRIVEFTTLFEPFLTSFSVEPQVSQYTIGKLMELASSWCHRHGLKAKYGSMSRWRADVELSCKVHTTRRGPMGTLRTRTCCAYCGCSGCHVACFLGCYWCSQ